MPAPAFVKTPVPEDKPPAEPIVSRRFQLPDLNDHGTWMFDRLQKVYPAVHRQILWTKLNSILYSTEFMFLYQKDAVSCAQLVTGNTINPKPAVHEWFTFVRDPADKAQVEAAATMYADYVRWAKATDAEVIVLSEHTDVPVEQAKVHLGGRIYERTITFAKPRG